MKDPASFSAEKTKEIDHGITDCVAAWSEAPHPQGLLAAEAWLDRQKDVVEQLRTSAQETDYPAEHSEAIISAWERARERVSAWVEAARARFRARANAEASIDLLATMPTVRKFVDEWPLQLFDPAEELGWPYFYAFNAAGEVTMFATDGTMGKDGYARAVRDFCAQNDVVALVMISETWFGHPTRGLSPEESASLDLSDLALCKRLGVERHERLICQVETAAGTRGWYWPIVHSAVMPRRLGAREDMGICGGGRFQNLLKPQPEKVN